MKNRFITETDFRQERDFGAKITATFEFLSSHWRPLGKCLLYIVLPAVLLMGIGMGLLTNNLWSQLPDSRIRGPLQYVTHTPAIPYAGTIMTFLGILTAFLLLVSTLYSYLRLRISLPAEQLVTPRLVWQGVVNRLGRVVLGTLLLVAFFTVLGGGLMFVGMMLHPLLVLLIAMGFAYLYVPVSLYFPLLYLEDDDVVDALKRAFALTYGHWWSSFSLYFVIGMLQGFLTILFALPQYATMLGKLMKIPGLDSDILGMLSLCIYAVGIVFGYVIPLLAMAFQYFNLSEKRDGWGAYLLLEQLGQTATPIAVNHQYSPDEEGEF